MHRELIITLEKIDETALARQRTPAPDMGAVVTFLGVVRGNEQGEPIAALDYVAFEAMARRQFEHIFDAVAQRWPIESIRVVHRLGQIAVGEASIWLQTVAPHREEAFAASQFVISEMKRVVPIWKKPVSAI